MAGLVLLSRLYRDLAELQESPYPGVRVFFDDANIRKFCLVLIPPGGPWKDLSLHFDVEIPSNWPTAPPRVQSTVKGVEHPNLFGSWICCDLLKLQYELPAGYTGGYTPALALRGLFLQFLTFFSSTEVEQTGGYKVRIGEARIRRYFAEDDDPLETTFPTGLYSKCDTTDSVQQELEERWNKLEGAEHSNPIAEDQVHDLVHIVKSTEPRPNRIHCFEYDNPRRIHTLNVINSFTCPNCPYGSSELPHHNADQPAAQRDPSTPSHPAPPPPNTCLLGNLNDDTLSVIISHLPTEYLFSFAQAYPRVRALAESLHIFLQRELECFFLRTPLDRSILGIGINFDQKTRILSSDFDWLSEYAFISYGVRKSIQKRDFTFFLPLAFSRSHFERAEPRIWACLSLLYQKVRSAMEASKMRQASQPYGSKSTKSTPPRDIVVERHKTASVVYRLMLNIVVSLMRSCDDFIQAHIGVKNNGKLLYASEKAIISYCHLFHLLICLSRVEQGIKADAIAILKRFIEDESFRHKDHNPDMGELIVMITLVLVLSTSDSDDDIINNGVTWETLSEPFLREAFTRNVRWNLKDSPDLEVLEEGPSEYRLHWTFQQSKTSLRLMMFQITFLQMFITTYSGESGFAKLDENYGFAEQGLPEKMVEEIKRIYLVDDWSMFFKRVRFEKGVNMDVGELSLMLRECVVASGKKGYHKAKSTHSLAGRRRNGEMKFAQERAKLAK
ncbi:hypothetical protein BDN72DRAFT_788571, partial [Pluteus cervinus]